MGCTDHAGQRALGKSRLGGNARVTDEFQVHLRRWVKSACAEWSVAEPGEEYYTVCNERLPIGLRTLLARGLSEGLILVEGHRFRLQGFASQKGPYQLFSNRPWQGGPHPNWEYYIQVAEYVRLQRVAAGFDLRLAFEDVAMDLALYHGNALFGLRRGQGKSGPFTPPDAAGERIRACGRPSRP